MKQRQHPPALVSNDFQRSLDAEASKLFALSAVKPAYELLNRKIRKNKRSEPGRSQNGLHKVHKQKRREAKGSEANPLPKSTKVIILEYHNLAHRIHRKNCWKTEIIANVEKKLSKNEILVSPVVGCSIPKLGSLISPAWRCKEDSQVQRC